MSKLIKSIAVPIITYIFPLIGNRELIINERIIVLSFISILMFISQPELNLKQSIEGRRTDRYSILFILAAGLLSQIMSVLEWGYWDAGVSGEYNTLMTWCGILLMAFGMTLRIWAIRHLNKYFTATVRIAEDHRLVKTGPYAIVRHPSYLGAYFAIVGSAVFLNTIVGTIAAATLMAIAYKYRIDAEEKVLINEFGEEYSDYIRSTPAVIPFANIRNALRYPIF